MSRKLAKELMSWAKDNITELEKQLLKNYAKAANEIELQLLKLDKAGSLTQSEIVKYGRLENLRNLIQDEIKSLMKENFKEVDIVRKESFIEGYKRYFEESGMTMPTLNTDFVKSSLENPLYQADFKEKLSEYVKKNSRKISDIITQGVTQGHTLADIANNMMKYVNNDAKKAITVARTETLRALSEGQLAGTDKLIERGFKVKKVWVYSYHVKGSRPDHEAMDGNESDDEGIFTLRNGNSAPAPHLFNLPEEDINCRCSFYNEIIQE